MDSLPSNHFTFSRPLRTYEGIWKKLRRDQIVTLVLIDVGFRDRVKKMIIKEKCSDLGFKILNEVERYHLKFKWDETKKTLTVRLVSRFGLTEVQG